MGDTPALLYLMDGDPLQPDKESYGGRFRKIAHSPRYIFDRNTTDNDTVAIYAVVELHFKGPQTDIAPDSVCFTMTVDRQPWNGYYAGEGIYAVRYVAKSAGRYAYTISSPISVLNGLNGSFIAANLWPGKQTFHDFILGSNWYTDLTDATLFDNGWQGAKTVSRWRTDVLNDWAKRWQWLRTDGH
jgi:hypothetical protein